MKTTFGKNRVTFEQGKGTVCLGQCQDNKLYDIVTTATKERALNHTLPIYFGNERNHTDVYSDMLDGRRF